VSTFSAFFSKFSCHGNTLLTVFSISEISDPKHPLNTNSEGILHRTEVMTYLLQLFLIFA